MRYKLRYHQTEIPLQEGEFTIGRSSTCDLVIDDARASREHAEFRMKDGVLVVRDLGSRNGVMVNGARIGGSTVLAHNDEVLIGKQELLVVATDTHPSRRQKLMPSVTLTDDTDSLIDSLLTNSDPARPERLGLLLTLCEKAIRLGHLEEAERLAKTGLGTVLHWAKSGDLSKPTLVHRGEEVAVMLAIAVPNPAWVTSAIELHTALGIFPRESSITEWHEAVRLSGYRDVRPLRDYLEVLRRTTEMSAQERFLLRRLEGLANVIQG